MGLLSVGGVALLLLIIPLRKHATRALLGPLEPETRGIHNTWFTFLQGCSDSQHSDGLCVHALRRTSLDDASSGTSYSPCGTPFKAMGFVAWPVLIWQDGIRAISGGE